MVSAVALIVALHGGDTAAYGLFSVNQPWVKPGVRTSEAYMVLTSTEGATLVGVRSSLAGQVHLRTHAARTTSVLPLPAGQPVSLRPGSDRIVLVGLSHALKLGERVPLTLIVETADGTHQEIAVDAEVRNESPLDHELHAHRH